MEKLDFYRQVVREMTSRDMGEEEADLNLKGLEKAW